MSDTVSIDIKFLEIQKHSVIDFFKKQIEAYGKIKRLIEKAEWVDARYDSLVTTLNVIGSTICDAINQLTNGNSVYIIDDVLDLANRYLQNENNFPTINLNF